MVCKRAVWAVFVLLPAMAGASSLEELLKVRQEHGIAGPASPLILKTLVQEQVVEIQGKVVGTIGGKGAYSILVKTNGVDVFVRSESIPDWVDMGAGKGRMIVRAVRESEFAELTADLIASAPESEVAEHDARLRAEAERMASERSAEAEKVPSGFGVVPNGGISAPIGGAAPDVLPRAAALIPDYTAYILDKNKRLSVAQAQQIAENILAYSIHYGVDARLVVALILAESRFDPTVTSSAGAQGLGQLMPATSKALGITDPFDIQQSLYGAVRTIRGHLDRHIKTTHDPFEALVLALAAYNAGPGAVSKYGGVPPYKETEAYIARVIRTFRQLAGGE
ncbi:MAG: lytic transglycosylase domain-containing protein [Armatimonadetes bacterium]|nr:lytic transglycosylase domain-containing protein [Armatimonadota bacterium]